MTINTCPNQARKIELCCSFVKSSEQVIILIAGRRRLHLQWNVKESVMQKFSALKLPPFPLAQEQVEKLMDSGRVVTEFTISVNSWLHDHDVVIKCCLPDLGQAMFIFSFSYCATPPAQGQPVIYWTEHAIKIATLCGKMNRLLADPPKIGKMDGEVISPTW